MLTTAQKCATTHPVQREVRTELKAIESAFKRVSKSSKSAISFLAKAGMSQNAVNWRSNTVNQAMPWNRYVLGYHGCDAKVARKIAAGDDTLKPSRNDYDWLGHALAQPI